MKLYEPATGIPPPHPVNRAAHIRSMKRGQCIMVDGRRSVVSSTCNRVLGKGCYQVQTINETQCMVWRTA